MNYSCLSLLWVNAGCSSFSLLWLTISWVCSTFCGYLRTWVWPRDVFWYWLELLPDLLAFIRLAFAPVVLNIASRLSLSCDLRDDVVKSRNKGIIWFVHSWFIIWKWLIRIKPFIPSVYMHTHTHTSRSSVYDHTAGKSIFDKMFRHIFMLVFFMSVLLLVKESLDVVEELTDGDGRGKPGSYAGAANHARQMRCLNVARLCEAFQIRNTIYIRIIPWTTSALNHVTPHGVVTSGLRSSVVQEILL